MNCHQNVGKYDDFAVSCRQKHSIDKKCMKTIKINMITLPQNDIAL